MCPVPPFHSRLTKQIVWNTPNKNAVRCVEKVFSIIHLLKSFISCEPLATSASAENFFFVYAIANNERNSM